jgi:predicted Zn-dependent protease
MSADATVDELRARAKDALQRLRGLGSVDDLAGAKRLVEALRNVRDYETMGQVAEAVSRRDPKDAKNRRLYAQYLIDTGKATAAIDLLRPLAQRLPKTDPESAEAAGLLTRLQADLLRCRRLERARGCAGAEAGDRRVSQAVRGGCREHVARRESPRAAHRAPRLGLRLAADSAA